MVVLLSLLSFAALQVSASIIQPRQNSSTPVSLVSDTKSVNATGGEAAVAAAGTLEPFGAIGVGCGINWEQGVSFGGGLQAGSPSIGLGGGYTITPDAFTIGAGIGASSTNASTQITVATNGSVSFTFASSTAFTCTEETINGMKGIQCRSG